jgi:hypothetical protein
MQALDGAHADMAAAEQLLVEPPVALETFPVSLLWHERTASHPAHLWLREQVRIVSNYDALRHSSPARGP